uniref:hypothetical protein n=1 Tax=Paractinoplanes polyasparticus TaxID=2856853 RepID=UPI001C84E5AF|nr:hypothetical protein [Actinoplanes polyasparticus]
MKLNYFQILDLKAVRKGEIYISSRGFEFEGNLVDDEARERLDWLWMSDYIDAMRPDDENESAQLHLTDDGADALTRAESP